MALSHPPAKLDNNIIKLTMRNLHEKMGNPNIVFASCPIWYNLAFTTAGNPLSYKTWKQLKILKISNIIEKRVFLTFEELSNKHNLGANAFLQCAQLASIFSKLSKEYYSYNTELDDKYRLIATNGGTLSGLSKMLINSGK